MSKRPTPLFDTYEQFNDLDFHGFTRERPMVMEFLKAQPEAVGALDSYRLVRLFLKQYNGVATTYNSYRTHIERLLLWSILVAKKPILSLKRTDAQDFIAFCQNPPAEWVGPVTKSRFIRIGGRKASDSDTYVVNEEWRPFNWVVSKAARKQASESNQALKVEQFSFNQASLNALFNVCSSFYEFMFHEGLGESNPIKSVKQRNRYKNQGKDSEDGQDKNSAFLQQDAGDARVLSKFQWVYILETAEEMADEDPSHERTLFIIACLFSMYLRVSDIVGRDNWTPTMGAFRLDSEGNWWMHVIGKGNKKRKVSVKQEFVDTYLKRYRLSRDLSPYPSHAEKTPLLQTAYGRGGLSDRHIRTLVQEVFDKAFMKMKAEGRVESEVAQLRSASLHWLRHTAATFDAEIRPVKHLQIDLGHAHQSTTENVYYNAIDDERAHTSRDLSIKDR